MQLPIDFQPGWAPADPDDASAHRFLFLRGALVVIRDGDVARLPDAAYRDLPLGELHSVGVLDGRTCHMGELLAPDLPEGLEAVPLRQLFNLMPESLLAVAGRAQQLLDFARSHRFCGACGHANELFDEGRARRCPACGQVAYPRLAPAMMALIKRDGPNGRELLLAHGARFPGVIYSALAGFVEPSESVEDCLHREVFEEVGLRVKNLRYFGSQCWPFPHSLMIAFVADWASGEIVADPAEIFDAAWFPIDALPPLPHQITIARRLINATIAEVAPDHPALSVYGAG
ncbi:NAD(+) diphosphatase [Niveibacterium sp.]|uniref:NAD(+) diphosphatase n=1 Tax=Niveibacterium sp. TaxID=2017444 RepID=UPI0035B121FA